MCGITGAIDLRGRRDFAPERLLRMCRAIAHRGPDDEHTHQVPGLALGARRLSIIDLAGGRQPLCNETGLVWAAFNGELYEYPEQFEILRGKGHRLSTRCDTELWVHWYEDHGERMFEQAKGQFAVSLWDETTRTLILGRDRTGICPLYYAERDGWLLWGSEIKALLASGYVEARADLRGIDNLFCYLSPGATRSCFEGVQAVPPGHYLIVRDGQVTLKKYWDLDFPDEGTERWKEPSEKLVDEFDHLLRQSVRRRLRGDVPVASYLSGGIDSTMVLALAMRESAQPVTSFTIGLTDAGKNEGTEATASARLLGSPLNVVNMRMRDMAQGFPELILAAEQPVLDTTCVCMVRLAREVRARGFKVVLSGEGSDEALAGYAWIRWEKMVRPLAGPLRWLDRAAGPRLRIGSPDGTLRRAAYDATSGVRTLQHLLYENVARAREVLFSQETWQGLNGHSPFDDLTLTNPRMARWHPSHRSLYVDYRVFLAGHLLSNKGDRTAMNASIEARPPFLDEDVIDFLSGLHPSWKLRGLTEKWLLRRVGDRYLPRRISRRRKHGFRAACSKTFLGNDRPAWIDQLLSQESLKATGYFDPAAVQLQRAQYERWGRRRGRGIAYDLGLTAVIATQVWHHTFCGGGLADLPHWSPPTDADTFSPPAPHCSITTANRDTVAAQI